MGYTIPIDVVKNFNFLEIGKFVLMVEMVKAPINNFFLDYDEKIFLEMG